MKREKKNTIRGVEVLILGGGGTSTQPAERDAYMIKLARWP